MSEPSRAAFDIPAGLTYLNCAYLSPLTRQVVEAGRQAVLRKAHPWQITYGDFFGEVERLRALFAALIGANADDIALVPSTAYGIATAAANLLMAPGENIVVPFNEHASTFHRWHVAATESGAELREARLENHRNWTDAIIARIDRHTRIVSVPHVHWSDGRLFDLDRIGKAARSAGAAFVIDGTQSVGALSLSVAELKPDFLTCSAYKWLLCPYGFGFLYVAPRFQSGRPLEEHFFHRAGVADHEGKLEQLEGYDTGARRFDTAERASFINVTMSITALEQLSAWSVKSVSARIAPVTARIWAEAAKIGYRPAASDQQAIHLFGLRRDGGLPEGLGKALKDAKVHVSLRGDAIRVSPHVFNDEADADRLVAALTAAN
jgi:selenocysteine lyase/cysteine desulfurase